MWIVRLYQWTNDAGYNLISGDVANLGLFLTPLVLAYHIITTHTCRANRWCLRPIWHTHPDHGLPICRRHHPHGGKLS